MPKPLLSPDPRVQRAAARLRDLLKSEGLTVTAFAARLGGVSRALIYGWLNGEREPNAEHLALIARTFKREPGWLLGLNNGYGRGGQSRGMSGGHTRELRELLTADALERAASLLRVPVERLETLLIDRRALADALLDQAGRTVAAHYERSAAGVGRWIAGGSGYSGPVRPFTAPEQDGDEQADRPFGKRRGT